MGVLLEILVALLLEFVVQVVLNVAFNFLAALGIESLKHAIRREGDAHPVLAMLGHFLLGLGAGGLSLLLVRQPMAAPFLFPGLSLIVAPLGNGLAMHLLGAWWWRRGHRRPVMFTFPAGAVFAGGMQLVRVLYFG